MGFRWNSPLAQVIAVGFICFCCPGMFNALNSLGGGGQLDSKVGQNANVALYTCFAIFGLLSGAIHNKLGPKWTIFLGCATYVLYAGSLLSYNHNQNGAFTIAAGGILGVGAGMLWTAQGAMMMAYPREQEKGRFIGYFWAIFNMGAVLGSVIAFAINFNQTETRSLGDATYAVFIALMGIGTLIALSLCPPSKFSTVNGRYFSLRTQSLNNILYWFSQIGGSYSFARVLDFQGVNRRTRALWGLAIITVCFISTWIGGIFFQRTYSIEDPKPNHDFKLGASYVGPLFLYMFYGLNDAAWQTYIYWLMGALSNDATVLSRYAGFYKCIQSSGAAISWRINAIGTAYMTELIICFALLVASIPGALFLALRIKDHSTEETYDLPDSLASDKHIQDQHF
ncbi:hypothetical protein BG015_008586 [Linnemannia schmuckeri]|uniref:MFS general substrate transporter n=1 Tax=Linnemannia schmuckeri TaxID=64567 RepID=A0A9P5RX47_9FUNG|nr:hypothetical protein BG015_008586 [Linnemannia schmuckeri]